TLFACAQSRSPLVTRTFLALHFQLCLTQPSIEVSFQVFNSLVLFRRDRHNLSTRKPSAKADEILVRSWQIHFVRHPSPRSFGKRGVIEINFASKMLQVCNRVSSFTSRHVENKKQ